MNRYRIIVCGILAMLAVAPLWALEFALEDNDLQKMSPQAKEAYQRGQGCLEHIDRDAALGCFVEAQKADPNDVAVRFLVAKMAVDQSKLKTGDEAVNLLNTAENALNEVMAMKDKGLKNSEIRRAEDGLAQVKNMKAKQAERDTAVQNMGKKIVKEHGKEMYPPEPEKKALTAKELQAIKDAKAKKKEAAMAARSNRGSGTSGRSSSGSGMSGMMGGGGMPGR
jgi:hypothetical protein